MSESEYKSTDTKRSQNSIVDPKPKNTIDKISNNASNYQTGNSSKQNYESAIGSELNKDIDMKNIE